MMPELGFVVFLIAIAYGMGTVWYTLLGRDYASWMRMAAFPFVGAIVGEELVNAGPSFFGLHLYVGLVSTLAAVVVDIAFTWLREQSPVGRIGRQALRHTTAILGR